MTGRGQIISNKIVITGVSSFIGFSLSKYFSNLNYSVIGIISNSRKNYTGIKADRINELSKYPIDLVNLDLVNNRLLEQFIYNYKPNYWIQHAGWAENYGSFEYDIKKGHQINVSPLKIIYPALAKICCSGVIVTGSSAEYSDGNVADEENDPAFPTMPYGLSKLTETLYSKLLAVNYNLPTRVIRVYIPFGEFDATKKLIPTVINSLFQKKSVALSPCTQKRDFIYIDDLMDGYLKVLFDLNRNEIFEIFNLCSGKAMHLKEFILILAESINANPKLLEFGAIKMRAGEPSISFGCNQKAKDVLKWCPESIDLRIEEYVKSIHG